MARNHGAGSQAQRVGRTRADLPRNARLFVRDLWPDRDDGTVIVHEQYQRPARWWQPATRLVGLLMILLAIGWPMLLLMYGWIKAGVIFAAADLTLLSTGLEVMKSGDKKWL